MSENKFMFNRINFMKLIKLANHSIVNDPIIEF